MSDEADNVTGKGTQAGSLDMSNPRDVGLLNETLRRRPKQFDSITPEYKREVCDGMLEAHRVARAQLTDPEVGLDAGRLIATIASVTQRMSADNMKDDHHAVDAARGAGEHKVENKIIVIPSPVVKDMAEMRKLAEKPDGQ